MLPQIFRSPLWNAAAWLMLASATAHMIILFFAAVSTRNFLLLNFFHILQIDLVFPINVASHPWLAASTALVLFGLFFLQSKNSNN